MLKKCCKCQLIQSINCFYKSSKTKDGFRYDCKKCGLQYQQENRELTRNSTNKWASKNRQKNKLKNQKLREKNKKKNENVIFLYTQLQCSNCLKIKTIKSFSKNSTTKNGYNSWCKSCLKKSNQEYKINNPDKVNALSKKRQCNKLQRTPKWLTEDDFRFISLFYKESTRLSKETGIKYHVDHIVPLQGKNVSGLHVPWNLQVITESENCSKQNKFVAYRS